MGRLIFLLLLLSATAFSQEPIEYWDSVRNSQYEWTCENAAGDVLSGHTRQDKAEVACSNRALTDGLTYYVRSGVYRVFRLRDPMPPVEPPVEPPIDPTDPLTFGPVTAPTEYPNSISALAQDAARWEITFTLNTVTGSFGLASRDQYGRSEAGHLSVWVENGTLMVRHQDIAGGVPDVTLQSSGIETGIEYVATVSFARNVGIGLWLDGVFVMSSADAFGTAGNTLSLIVGGLCTRCSADGVTGPDRPIDGTVAMAIYDTPLELPQPTASVELNWTLPTQYEDDTALPPGIPDQISIYHANPRVMIAALDGESITYEVTDLFPGEYCFVATAWDGLIESRNSNVSCKQAQ